MTVTAPMAPSDEIRDTVLELYRRMLAAGKQRPRTT